MIEIFLVVGGVGAFLYLNGKIANLESTISQLRGNERQALSTPEVPVAVTPLLPETVLKPLVPPVVEPVFGQQPPSATFDEESGGRWLGRVGIASIFIGVAFFLKYAFDTNLIGIVGRINLGIITGVIFIAAGQYLRKKYEQYAYLLVGGGVAILYLSFYVAFALYHLISQPFAFALMMLVTMLTVFLSLFNDSQSLSVLAIIGGFATPYLISNGQNDPVSLFTYIAILTIAMIALALQKNWPALTYISFVGTGLQYFTWYASYYSPGQLPVAFLFLTFFFLIYLSLPTLHTLMGTLKTKEEDLLLATINAFCFFGTAYMLLNPLHHDSIWILALLLGVVYYMLAYLTYSIDRLYLVLCQYYAGIATLFLTIAIPLKLGHSWIILAWLIEAALLYVIAFRYSYASFKIFAAGVYIVAVCKLFFDYQVTGSPMQYSPFVNQYFALFLVAIVVAYMVSYLYSTHPEEGDTKTLAGVFFVTANILSVYILTSQISALYDQQINTVQLTQYGSRYNVVSNGGGLDNQRNTVISIVWSVYAILLIGIGFIARIRLARVLGLVFFFLTACKIFIDVWSLGELYRVTASIVFGAVALLGSFVYVTYSQRIKEMIL